MDLLGAPSVGKAVQHDVDDLDVGVVDLGDAPLLQPDMRVSELLEIGVPAAPWYHLVSS